MTDPELQAAPTHYVIAVTELPAARYGHRVTIWSCWQREVVIA
jgi:hypothetical protein